MNRLKRAIVYIFVAAGFTIATQAQASETHVVHQGAKPESMAKGRLIVAEEVVGNWVADYTLIDQDGKTFQLKEFSGKPYLINFVYTSCTHACPLITASLADAVKKVEKHLGTKFNVLTVGFDQANDTPQAMKEFGQRFLESFDGWTFATADGQTIEALTADFGFYYQKERLGGFAHMNMVTLVDSEGKINRHIYGMQPKKKEILKPLKKIW